MADEFDDNPRFDYRGGNFRLNGRIMITAIVCLFVVIIMVILLHIYARCVLRRQARRRAAIRQLTIVTTTNTAYPNEQPKRGLDESVIALLPTFVYKTVDHTNTGTGSNSIECSVCLSLLEDGEIARLLPNCNHTFHAECIDMWLSSHSTCPICRTEAEPSPVAEQSSSESAVELGVIGVAVPATAPPTEGTSSGCANSVQCSAKVGRSESSSRLSSFRRMLTRERSERRTQTPADGVGDIERQ